MKREFILRGLDCANCAAKIEASVKALNGVKMASCSVVSSLLVLEAESFVENSITADVRKIVSKYEPDVVVIPKDDKNVELIKESLVNLGDNEARGQIIQLLLGLALFAGAIAINNDYVKLFLFLASYIVVGRKVVFDAVMGIFRRQAMLNENFLMTIATVGAFAVGEHAEAVAVMTFYLIGEFFQDMAVRRSKKSIADLMDIRPEFANIMINGELKAVKPDTVNVGDIIMVKPGEKIPLDGVVIEGEATLDTRALTGESVPRSAKPGRDVISGCVNLSGVLKVKVTKAFGESTVSKIINMVENAGSRKAPTENFITTFSRYYTPAVVGLALLLAILPPLLMNGAWGEWIHRALVFLVISCPCALVISIPLSFFGGIGGASRKGILVKGGNYLEALTCLDIIVFDKTGTLTKGIFEVTGIYPAEGFSDKDLLKYAAYAEAFSGHPIAQSILNAFGGKLDKGALKNYMEFSGHGVSAELGGLKIIAGNDKLMKKEGIPFKAHQGMGTRVYVAVDKKYAGCIKISDELKPDSFETVQGLKRLGVRKTVMLTGDNAQAAEAVSKELGLDEVYSELLPDQKVEILEELDKHKRMKGKLAFIGDGINDAPVLARADIGIAMGGLGSDAAIEAADVVLMTDEPSKLIDAVIIAKATKYIVWQNIIFALGIKAVFLILGAFGLSGMWEAVFADTGVAILAILNSLRALNVKTR